MKFLTAIKDKLGNISKAGIRFPISIAFLLVISILNAIRIEDFDYSFTRWIFSALIGVFLFAVARVLYERTGSKLQNAIIFYASGAVLTVLYFFFIAAQRIDMVAGVRTSVILFILTIAFIWIPSIKSSNEFNVTFLVVFKGIITTAFFSAIIWGGITLIITAIDRLLFRVDTNIYSHIANIIWVVFAPVLFLSTQPVYNGQSREDEKVEKAGVYPKFFEILISFVLIPLAAAYSLVLLGYIGKTIALAAWDDNLLEPLILSYCIAVIVLYLLASRLNNVFAKVARLIFPKVMAPIAAFQIFSSLMNSATEGIYNAKYFVLLFCLFAVVIGVLLSIVPVRKSGLIAILAIVFATVSITPFIDVFSVTRISQTAVLRSVLEKNGMIEGNTIVAKSNISSTDQKTINNALNYINNNKQLDKVNFLPQNFNLSTDFMNVFGYEQYFYDPNRYVNKNFILNNEDILDISGYDYIVFTNISQNKSNDFSYNYESIDFKIKIFEDNEHVIIKLTDKHDKSLLQGDIDTLIEEYSYIDVNSYEKTMSQAEMTHILTEGNYSIRIIFKSINISIVDDVTNWSAEVYILVDTN
ncbi:MAG: hypothetical protein A2Y17_05615 [Clostridiales bacterium GWF2_38_85]|nr:MAG: hypothetical protein A2Y17_05615 [Clostridiales bacterium GWF2_38_85]HBL84041.1 hypothetical protein [Clostridiales bacterium]